MPRRQARILYFWISTCPDIRVAKYCGICAPGLGALVLVVTSSDSEQDRREMSSLGANGYFRKPPSFEEFMKLGALARELLTLTDDPSGSSA